MRPFPATIGIILPLFAAAVLLAPAMAQSQKQPPATTQQPPAPAGPAPVAPYKPVTITLPLPLNDPAFESFRGQLAEVAKKKDRAGLAKIVVAKGFFWERENGNAADKKKSGIDNFSVALGLNNKDAAGWDMLAGYAEDPTVSASVTYQGAMCAPADPGFNGKEMEALLDASQTDISEWGYPVVTGIEVRAGPQASAPVTEKLGLHFIRVMPDTSPAAAVASSLRIVTPGGKLGYIPGDSVAPLGNDQLCYVKDAGAWKIGGYIGGGDAQ